jgi:hypothetical protein
LAQNKPKNKGQVGGSSKLWGLAQPNYLFFEIFIDLRQINSYKKLKVNIKTINI